ncbi:MAG: thioredoxin domain-containing protein, partial [bacterium]
LCPYCGRHFNDTLPALLEKYGAAGRVQYVYRDFPIASLHPTSAKGHEAALCVGEQGAALFWAMHDELFRTQGEWTKVADPAGFLRQRAQKAGAKLTAYDTCMRSGKKKRVVEDSVAAGNKLGFNGTPTFRITRNATGKAFTLTGSQPVAMFNDWLDAVLAGKAPPEPPKPELPAWAKPEGLAPDPKRPGETMAGDQYLGSPDAPLTVVEFSDFQCGACKRHALETQPVVLEKFVDTGKIRWVFKHRPLGEHEWAGLAAVAAECAGEQDRFWPMHHLLFEKQDQWATAEADRALAALADQLKLDRDRFTACFNGRKALERVVRDLYDAERVTRATPTFIAVYGGQGMVVQGVRAPDQFVPILEKVLKDAAPAGNDTVAKRDTP